MALELTTQEIKIEACFHEWATSENPSLGRIAREHGFPVSAVVTHAAKFLWRARMVEIASEASQRTREKLVETSADITAHHIRCFQTVGTKAFKALTGQPQGDGLVFDRATDAMKALVQCVEMERKLRGMGERSEDVASVLAEKMKQLEAQVQTTPGPKKIEFEFEAGFVAGDLPEEGEEEEKEK